MFGVITEPGEHTTNISLYGIETREGSWVVITLDFDPIFHRDCADDDYYEWRPWNDVTIIALMPLYSDNITYNDFPHYYAVQRSDTDCILGNSMVIERRNRMTCCRNSHDYVRETNLIICECNRQDYEWYMHTKTVLIYLTSAYSV